MCTVRRGCFGSLYEICARWRRSFQRARVQLCRLAAVDNGLTGEGLQGKQQYLVSERRSIKTLVACYYGDV